MGKREFPKQTTDRFKVSQSLLRGSKTVDYSGGELTTENLVKSRQGCSMSQTMFRSVIDDLFREWEKLRMNADRL